MKNKGITLLALIVTVIIMVILASVTIKLITDGEIINKSREATEEYLKAQEQEEWQLAVAGAKNYLTGEINLAELEENLPDWEITEEEDQIVGTSPNGNEFTAKITTGGNL